MPENVDEEVENIPSLHSILPDDIPNSVLRSIVRRWQAADHAEYSVSAFENFVGHPRDDLHRMA